LAKPSYELAVDDLKAIAAPTLTLDATESDLG